RHPARNGAAADSGAGRDRLANSRGASGDQLDRDPRRRRTSCPQAVYRGRSDAEGLAAQKCFRALGPIPAPGRTTDRSSQLDRRGRRALPGAATVSGKSGNQLDRSLFRAHDDLRSVTQAAAARSVLALDLVYHELNRIEAKWPIPPAPAGIF